MLVSPFGKKFRVKRSTRKNKQLMAVPLSNKKLKTVHFGDKKMPEYPGTARGDQYCSRSYGIGNLKDVKSANFWSRWYLWNCKGKKSMNRRPKL